MPKHIYYYNFNEIDLEYLKSLKYVDALRYKIQSAEILLKELVKDDLENRQLTRINDIIKAIKFNKELISEVEF